MMDYKFTPEDIRLQLEEVERIEGQKQDIVTYRFHGLPGGKVFQKRIPIKHGEEDAAFYTWRGPWLILIRAMEESDWEDANTIGLDLAERIALR